MKISIILFILFFYCPTAFSQKKPNQIKILMDSSVRMTYVFVLNGALNHHLPVDFLKNIYLLDENFRPLDYLGDSVNRLFKFIDIEAKKNRKLLTKGISAWLVTYSLNNNQLSIWVADFTAKYVGKKHFKFGTSGGSKIVFEFDCSTQEWVFKSFNYGGN